MNPEKGFHNEKLLEVGQIEERPFQSTVPIIGPLIAGFRNFWNSMAAKWAYRQLIQQQNAFNAQVVQRLTELENQVYQQMIEQDREQTHLLRETAELSTTLTQLNRLLQDLDKRLARMEISQEKEN